MRVSFYCGDGELVLSNVFVASEEEARQIMLRWNENLECSELRIVRFSSYTSSRSSRSQSQAARSQPQMSQISSQMQSS